MPPQALVTCPKNLVRIGHVFPDFGDVLVDRHTYRDANTK